MCMCVPSITIFVGQNPPNLFFGQLDLTTTVSMLFFFPICNPSFWPGILHDWIIMQIYGFITGWWIKPLWKNWTSGGMIIPNVWKNEKWSKPPTRIVISKTNSWKAWKDNLLANSKWIWELIYQISKWRSGRHGNIANLGAIPLLNSISFPMPPSTVYHQAPIKPHFKETNRWNLVMSIPD
jgi:hypothetical protein